MGQLGRPRGPKWEQDGTQIGTKNDTENNQKKHRFWEATRGTQQATQGGVNPLILGPHPSRGTVRKVRKATARGPDGIWDSRTVGQKRDVRKEETAPHATRPPQGGPADMDLLFPSGGYGAT